MRYQLEICCTSFSSARTAQVGGANRIELCDNLYQAGTTPSYGLIQKIIDELAIDVFVLIRPRGGDFVFSEEEFDIILRDIAICKELGVKGIVSGVLNEDFTIDKERTRILVEAAHPLPFTFHRAFDLLEDQRKGLADLIEIGANRILTSGGQDNVIKGLDQLSELVRLSGAKIKILAGGGLKASNIEDILSSGCVEFHTTARKWVGASIDHSKIRLNSIAEIPEVGSFEVDLEEVQTIKRILDRHS